MARIRTIKPDFFTSETVSALSFRARLTWIGLWTHCDDLGRSRDNVKLIKAAVWPLDNVSLRDVEEDLIELEKNGLLFKYEVDGRSYLQITAWAEHQKVDRPSKSPFPGPEEGSRATREPASSPRESLAQERKGKEGKGRDAHAREEPPSRCPKHLDDPSPPPCGPCGEARRSHEKWLADQPAPNRLSGSPDYDTIARQAARGESRAQLAAAARAALAKP